MNIHKKNANFQKKSPKIWKNRTQLTKGENNGEKEPNQQRQRVPAIYGATAKLLKKVNEGAGLKDALYQINHPNLRGIYALACKAIQNDELLGTIINETGLLNERFDPVLAKVLVTELLWGKQELKGGSTPVTLTLEHEKALRQAVEEASIPVVLTEEKPLRYIRINTLLVTINGTIQRLIDDGWQLQDTPENYELFIKCASNLGENQIMKDYHLDDVLIFPPKSDMHEHKLVENGSLLLQDKASCLPALAFLSKNLAGSLDMCAAPGLKLAIWRIYCRTRVLSLLLIRTLKDFIECKKWWNEIAGNIIVSQRNLQILFDSLLKIALECRMISRVESQRKKDVNPSGRIQSLSQYQERLLVQAMTAFPDVERIVYTTSSLFEEENEQVVAKALSRVQSFQVVPPQLKKPWDRRGSPEYPFGSNCLVADQDKDNTDGFFVAVLERIPGIACLSVNAMSEKRKNATLDETKDSDGGTEVKKEKKDQENKQLQIYDDGDEEAT
ncbi:Putative methyltransferase NSUN5-like Protein [Gryllus bimaculatus]|nr:Putative methyltransferase NSUN5-like Protein [Gryllus bimaculatus]